MINIEQLRKRMLYYFIHISDKQLEEDMEKAGYSFYKHVTKRVFSEEEDNYDSNDSNIK